MLPTYAGKERKIGWKGMILVMMVVMMVEPNQSRGQWKVGWIVETFPKADGYSLNGESQTKDGNCIKPFH